MYKKMFILVFILPLTLFAQEATPINSDLTYVYGHCFTVVNQSEFFVAYRLDEGGQNQFMVLDGSIDGGHTWQTLDTFADSAYHWENSFYLDHYNDTLLLVEYMGEDSAPYIRISKMPITNVSDRRSVIVRLDDMVDQIKDFKYRKVKIGENKFNFYFAFVGKKGDIRKFVVLRSSMYDGVWTKMEKIIERNITDSSQVNVNMLDFDAAYSGSDVVRIVWTMLYRNTSSHESAIYAEEYKDVIGSITQNVTGLIKIKDVPYTFVEAKGKINGSFIVWTIQENSTWLYFAYSNTDLSDIVLFRWDKSSLFNSISEISMTPWKVGNTEGFHLVFTDRYYDNDNPAGYRIIPYYGIIVIDRDTISLQDPVRIINGTYGESVWKEHEFPPYVIDHHGNPYIVWEDDQYYYYVTSVPHILYLGSYLEFAYLENPIFAVNERGLAGSSIGKLNLVISGSTLKLSLNDKVSGRVWVRIIDAQGRNVIERVVNIKEGTGYINVHNLKRGVYFVVVQKQSEVLREKFVKLK